MTSTKRRTITVLLTSCLLLTATSLIFSFYYFDVDLDRITTAIPSWALKPFTKQPTLGSWVPDAAMINATIRPGTDIALALENVPLYLHAALDSQDPLVKRLQCPETDSLMRYTYLARRTTGSAHRKYLFALDIYDAGHILPRLLASIIDTCRFLGPHSCALSVVEGRSTDGTYETFKLLAKPLQELDILYFLQTDDIDPGREEWHFRIETLSGLRNLAMQPFLDSGEITDDATVIFLNDVAICREDILELIHQRHIQKADMTCAMDWGLRRQPVYYDAWIGRGITGDSYFLIPTDGKWEETDLFWNDPPSRKRLDNYKPFQVFACWNGGVTFAFEALRHGLRFRAHQKDECYQGEPQLWCKDLWYNGMGKIAVVPSINLGYSDADGKRVKKLKGYVYQHVERENDEGAEPMLIDWQKEAPEQVKCVVNWGEQYWVPWNESLPIGNKTLSDNITPVEVVSKNAAAMMPRRRRAVNSS